MSVYNRDGEYAGKNCFINMGSTFGVIYSVPTSSSRFDRLSLSLVIPLIPFESENMRNAEKIKRRFLEIFHPRTRLTDRSTIDRSVD